MKKLIAWYRRIPRRVRIVRNLLLAAVLLCLFYIFAGCPDMTAEQGYQRALRRRLLGPGEVVGILNVDVNGGYNRLLLGETEKGVTLYCYRHENLGFLKGHTFSSWEGTLVYREKGETVTAMAAPGVNCTTYQEEIHVPVILFDECPKAVRAELDVCLTGTYDFEDYEFAYSRKRRGKPAGTLSSTCRRRGINRRIGPRVLPSSSSAGCIGIRAAVQMSIPLLCACMTEMTR